MVSNEGTSLSGKLTARFAETVTKPGRHGDANGLYLVVKPSGAKSWVLRTVVRGRRCDMGLGGYPLVSLAEAREAAFANRKLARAGGDPLALKRRSDIPVFEEAARTVIEIHKPTWRDGGKSAGQWTSSLRQYAFPRLASKPVDAITTADVMAVLLPIWAEKSVTARRVRQRISAVMKWAVAQGYRGDNPAGDAIASALPRVGNRRRHFRSVHHTEAGDAIRAVWEAQAPLSARLAFEFLVLTATRSGEVRGASWSEFDVDAATWTIPDERMKGGREHRVPLSNRALAILEEARTLDDGSGLAFPAPTGRKPMSGSALSKVLRELGIDAVPHGFRSTFRDWCSESARVPREVAEACLAHVVKGVEGAYARSDLLDRRRKLMDRWAAYLASDAGDKVVSMTWPSGEAGQ